MTDVDATFLVWNLSGQLIGFQVYNPSYPKHNPDNPKLAKYYTYLSRYRWHNVELGMWGLETYDPKKPLFVQEGIFDANRLKRLGYNAVAVFGADPLNLTQWFRAIPNRTLSMCDGDAGGFLLAHHVDRFHILPPGMDVDDLTDDQIVAIADRLVKKGNDMLRFGEAPYLECSSKGDRRLSAFYARVKKYGNMSIETLYQRYKVFEGGQTGLSWQEAKGKCPINIQECRKYYEHLWILYIYENPELQEILKKATGFSDVFGQKGHACQAEELWRIRERLLQAEQFNEAFLVEPFRDRDYLNAWSHP